MVSDMELLIELICKEQNRLTSEDIDNYKSERYIQLERIKIVLKESMFFQ